jgi:hypothetical protein
MTARDAIQGMEPARMKTRLHRSRCAWLLAIVATVLNFAAPVFAYAEGQPLHPSGHMHHHGDAAPHHAPVTPHCPYCLDFAAGAALAPPPLIVAAPPRLSAPLSVRAPVAVVARASLRLASPRAPPSQASA